MRVQGQKSTSQSKCGGLLGYPYQRMAFVKDNGAHHCPVQDSQVRVAQEAVENGGYTSAPHQDENA